jgi:hypothetical protein
MMKTRTAHCRIGPNTLAHVTQPFSKAKHKAPVSALKSLFAKEKAKVVPDGSWPVARPPQDREIWLSQRLHEAAGRGDVKDAKDTLEAGIGVDARDRLQRTPLMGAAFHGRIATVEFLIANGANANARDIDGNTVLDMARIGGKADVVKFLERRMNK